MNLLSSEAKIKYDPSNPEKGVALSWGLAAAAKMDGKVFATSKFDPLVFPDPGWKYTYEPADLAGGALAANSLCRGQEKRTMRESEGQFGNSGEKLQKTLCHG